MKIKSILIISIIAVFTWQSVAYAASISTRVRILESKVAKHDKAMKDAIQSQNKSEIYVNKSLKKVQALEKKMDKLIEEKSKNKRAQQGYDKRYAFP